MTEQVQDAQVQRVRRDELSDGVVLRALRRGARGAVARPRARFENKKARRSDCRAFVVCQRYERYAAGLAQAALVTGRGVAWISPLRAARSSSCVAASSVLGGRLGGLSLLQRSPQGGTLRTVAHGRRARLTHVLLGGCDIRHEKTLQKTGVNSAGFREGLNLRDAHSESQGSDNALTLLGAITTLSPDRPPPMPASRCSRRVSSHPFRTADVAFSGTCCSSCRCCCSRSSRTSTRMATRP